MKHKYYSISDRPPQVGLSFEGVDSLTKQSFVAEADINTIVSRYDKSGVLPSGERSPTFGDFTNLDYRRIQNQIVEVNEMFASLPPELRRVHGNDPAALMDWLANPENRDEAIKLGLFPSTEAQTPPNPQGNPVSTPPTEPVKPPVSTPAAVPAPAASAQ